MSHSLRTETRRWSHTLAKHSKVYVCVGVEVETEQHMLVEYLLTVLLHDRYPVFRCVSVNEMLNRIVRKLVEICNYILKH